ncbi:peptidase S13 (D-alanyl-D-alanine carboxypeptidase [Rhodococcoides trifolii]|uniref:Peptidase S13 (D-alanyl-D-alanine carboxypeptidase) n=1 Tax=Rhodococcoides trifolii TaxID=908250 RepID=A0A917G3U7_9NOCA|nr:peptidase S13 (D-alanyl-D-alanine carboxypeptidase [Rhodococcus trifolii]
MKRSGGTLSSRTQVIGLAVIVVAVVFALTLLLLNLPFGSETSDEQAAISPEPSAITATPQVAPLPDDAPIPTNSGLSAVLAGPLANPDLGRFTGIVHDAKTGDVLWSSNENSPMTPASTTKVLTAAAAMIALPDDHRVETRVVKGQQDGQIVVIAGGDTTLTAQPVGAPVFYAGGARIDDIAEQVRRSGVPVNSIVVDTSIYSGDLLAKGWFPADISGGSLAPMEPLMLDGARSNPLVDESPRSTTPALDVGRAIASALGVDPAAVSSGTAPQGADQLASVQSAPLRQRLGQMMGLSDNLLAESVGREIALEEGKPASFTGAVDAVISTLTTAGFNVNGVSQQDVSGLSVDNVIPARVLGDVVTAAATDSDASSERNVELRPMLDYLPVAGATGTLADRYASGDRTAAGWLRAKTGTLSTASALAGYVVDASGRVLTFALMSNDRPPEVGRPALDAVASALRSCGCT